MGLKVFCFVSAKGGSGKTIISSTFGTALAHLGKKVILIDADGSTNGMTLLYLERVVEARDKTEEPKSLSGLFDVGDTNHSAVEIQKGLWLLPATFVMAETHEVTANEFDRNLLAAISQYKQEFDYVIIDAQAGIEDFALSAIEYADQTVVVSEYDPISEKGIKRLKKMINSNQSPKILYNKVLPEFVEKMGDPLNVSDILPPIPWNADVVRAYVKGTLALNMENGNVFTVGLLRTAGVLFGRGVQELIEKWRKDKDDFIRAPIRTQLDKVAKELEDVQRIKVTNEYEATSGVRVSIYFWMIALLIGVSIASWFMYSLFMERELMRRANELDINIEALERNTDYDIKLHESLTMERFILNTRIRALGYKRLYSYGIAVAVFCCFVAYFLWHVSSRKKKKLELLQTAAIYSDRVDELRAMKSQLMAYEQSSLDELIQRNV